MSKSVGFNVGITTDNKVSLTVGDQMSVTIELDPFSCRSLENILESARKSIEDTSRLNHPD